MSKCKIKHNLPLNFWQIRQRGGWDNNPSAKKFKGAYKKLLFQLEVKNGKNSNCWQQAQIRMLHVSSAFKTGCNPESTCEDILHISDEDYQTMREINELSAFKQSAVPYIAGFVVKKVIPGLECNACACALIASSGGRDPLIARKNARRVITSLYEATPGVVKVCSLAEADFRGIRAMKGLQAAAKAVPYMVTRICNEAMGLLQRLTSHAESPLDNHVVPIVKQIVRKYLEIRIAHAAREENEWNQARNGRCRYMNNRVTIYRNQ